MNKVDLIILAAGKGSRMQSNIPKALHSINNKVNLQNTLEKTNTLFKNVYIIVNEKDKHHFDNFDNVISIQSGLGSGHAIMQSIEKIENLSNNFCIVWGDAYFENDKIFKEIIEYDNEMCIPLQEKKHPYVTFKIDDNFNIQSVDFSKYGEIHEYGLQDKCLFKVNKIKLYKALKDFHNCTYKDGRYITESNEFEFLYVMHVLANNNNSMQGYITDENTVHSYNTKDEIQKIEEYLNANYF